MMSHRMLAALIGLWAAVTWGGRIGLLTGDETLDAKARIVASLAVAAAAVAGLLLRAGWARAAVTSYSVVTIGIWLTSVASVLGDSASSGGFKAMHVALAALSIALAVVAWGVVVRRSAPEPAHRSEARSPTGR